MESQSVQRIFLCSLGRWLPAVFALSFFVAGLSSRAAQGGENSIFAGPSELVATMPAPNDVHLQWKNHATVEGGNLVEFQMYPAGATLPADEREQFLILGFLNSKDDTFRHEKLGSETVFSYRIRPYFGHCSEPVSIMTGSAVAAEKEPEEPEGPLEDAEKSPKSGNALESIRTPGTFVAATPADVAVALSSATHVVVRWRERAADAEGYLVEISQYADRGFQVCALLPPHTTSFRKIALPPETKIYFRVRAFFYGPPSNVVTKTTGPEPLEAVGTGK
jgi:hypothetical protein